MADELVQAMVELYHTMARMCGNQAFAIHLAPEGGHVLPPKLTAILEVRKDAAAIDFMRKIPYIEPMYHILPNSESINYLEADMRGYSAERHYAWKPIKYGDHFTDDGLGESIVDRCEVPITTYDDGVGYVLVVNCETYTARLWGYDYVHGCDRCTIHTDDTVRGPPMCKHAVSGVPEERPAVDFFREWRQNYLNLTWMLSATEPELIHGYADEDWFEIRQRIFRDHGWPDDFRGEDCLRALESAPGPFDDTYDSSDTDEEGDHESRTEL